jgi:Secretion system C-terminal sorting domain
MKIKKIIVISIMQCVLFSMNIDAQVWNGNLTFSNQADIDNFSNSNYTIVNGAITISDDLDGQHDIRNLAGLAGITAVTGAVSITNNNFLVNTVFLNFTSIGGNLRIQNNASLSTINGLSNLGFLGLQLSIENNSSLTSVTAFGSLTSTNSLRIAQNPLLNNLSGLSNLAGALQFMVIDNNTSLTSIASFSNITGITNLFISNNAALTTLNGLQNLQKSFIISIVNNTSLASMAALGRLHVVNGAFTIEQNPVLVNIQGLETLDTLANLKIEQNNAITSIQGPSAGCTTTGRIEIFNNPSLTAITGFSGTRVSSIDIENNWVLSSLNAFPNLEVASDFKLVNNYNLATINPMPNLSSIRILEINADTILTNLSFLQNLAILNQLNIRGCSRLENIDGLARLQSTELDELVIAANRSLANINVFANIVKINQLLNVGNNPSLSTLQGLQNIRKVGNNCTIAALPLLNNVNHLIHLDSVGGALLIALNPQLQNLDGLKNLQIVRGTLVVQNNPVLYSFCGLYTLYSNGGPADATTINQNLVNPTAAQIIAGGACSVALPVFLQLFNITCEENKVLLKWNTTQELNSSHFTVDRSADGRSWTAIAHIPAAGNTSSTKDYLYTDNAAPQNALYRLAQYDLDGRVHYSAVLRAACATKDLFAIGPNPVTNKLYVSVTETKSSAITINLYDTRGNLVKKQGASLLRGTNQLTIEMDKLATGLYHLSVEWNNGTIKKTRSVFKQ